MKRTIIVALATALLFGLIPGVTQAQEETLDSRLARAASKSVLITLVRPELTATRDFYLTGGVNADGVIGELGEVTGFEVVEANWATAETYAVTATVQPSGRTLTLYSAKYNGRWKVDGLELAAAETGDSVAVAVSPASVGPSPVSGNGSGVLIIQSQSGGDFYRINADGTGLQRISYGIDPQLSPDGTQVAFTRWEPKYELFTINIDGTNERAWTSNWRQMKSPTWSADGTAITFSYQEGGRLNSEDFDINIARTLAQGDKIDIPTNAVGLEVENGILKYSIPADAHWYLKRIDLGSGQLTDLATERHSYGPTGHPTQPDLVAYKGIQGVAINNLTTNTDQPISTDHRDHTPVISPDGSRVAVSYWQNGNWEVHTMNLDGSNRVRLTTTPLSVIARNGGYTIQFNEGAERVVARANPWWNNAAPTWSPDGSQIAFVTDRTGQWEVWIMNADGSNQRRMFPTGALDGVNLTYAGVDERILSWQ